MPAQQGQGKALRLVAEHVAAEPFGAFGDDGLAPVDGPEQGGILRHPAGLRRGVAQHRQVVMAAEQVAQPLQAANLALARG